MATGRLLLHSESKGKAPFALIQKAEKRLILKRNPEPSWWISFFVPLLAEYIRSECTPYRDGNSAKLCFLNESPPHKKAVEY